MSILESKYLLRHTLVNFLLVAFFIMVHFLIFNGAEHEFPFNEFFLAVILAFIIIFFQYKFLVLKKNWLYRMFIYYLSMSLFLFLFGFAYSFFDTFPVSINAKLNGAVNTILVGQLSGGLIWFFVVFSMNYMLKEFFFNDQHKNTSSL